MEIKDRIKNLGKLFKEMQVTLVDGEQYIYVVVVFHPQWDIDKEKTLSEYGVDAYEGNGTTDYYFVAPIESGFEKVFDAIEFNIQRNKTKIEKAEIFKEKLQELESLFENDDITPDVLKTLEFQYKDKGKFKKPQIILTKEEKDNKNE